MSTNCTDGRDGLLGLDDLGELVEARVGNLDHADVRLDGAERVVRGFGLGGGQGIEQRRLADVRKTDDSEFEHDLVIANAIVLTFTGEDGRRAVN